jgi:hypothetical protein
VRQLARGCVEARQVVILLTQQALEPGHTIVICSDGDQLRVVESCGDPLVVLREVNREAVLERVDGDRQLGEEQLLAAQLGRAWRS